MRIEAIIATIVTFGEALKLVRGERTGRDLARLALGPDASPQHVRDYANNLSKVEHNKVPNVGLIRLGLIAKGLGITLSVLFRQIEALQEGKLSDKNTLIPTLGVVDATPRASADFDDGATAERHDDEEVDRLRHEIDRLHDVLRSAGEVLLTAGLSGARKPDAARPHRATGRGGRGGSLS